MSNLLELSSRPHGGLCRQVFTKLGISSRSQLDRALPGDPATVSPH